jgi:hypothetical protein
MTGQPRSGGSVRLDRPASSSEAVPSSLVRSSDACSMPMADGQ